MLPVSGALLEHLRRPVFRPNDLGERGLFEVAQPRSGLPPGLKRRRNRFRRAFSLRLDLHRR